tara:strand:+ start:1650 stop:2192 length:543 start_codon:yes stop_codon:yes gene_type:complete
MSTLKVNSIIPVAGVPTGGGGGIIQTISNVYTSRVSVSIASQGVYDFTAFETTITPTSSTSKILVLGQLAIGHDGGQYLHVGLRINGSITAGAANGNGVTNGSNRIAHIGVNPPNNQAAGSTPINFLHSPNSTSEQAYTFQLSHTSGSTRNLYINYGGSSSTNAETGSYISTVTLFEVSA